MQGTFNNLRYGPESAPSFEEQNTMANLGSAAGNPFAVGIPPAGAPAGRTVSPSLDVAAGNVFGGGLPAGERNAILGLPPETQLAGIISGAGEQGQIARFQTALRDAGVSLDPNGQLPEDFAAGVAIAKNLYNNIFSSSIPPPGALASGSESIAPTGLRERALAANGAPIAGFAGTVVSGVPGSQVAPDGRAVPVNQQTGARFTLTQNPNTVPGAPGYVPAANKPLAPSPVVQSSVPSSAFDRNAAAFKQATTKSSEVVTAPDGSRFMRDSSGRLQPVGVDPELAANAAGLKAGAEADAKKSAENAHALMTAIHDSAESARIQSGSIKRISDLYRQGADSGFAQPILTQAKALLQRAGLKVEDLSTQQQLEKELGTLALETSRELMKGSGTVSNYERELVQKATANTGLTPQANLAILGVLQRIAERNVLLNQERVRLDDMGVPAVQIAKELRRLQEQTPIGVEELQGISAAPAAVKIISVEKVSP